VLVRIEGDPLAVTGLPSGDEFDVGAGGLDVRIDDFLFSVFDAAVAFPEFGLDASFSAVQGRARRRR